MFARRDIDAGVRLLEYKGERKRWSSYSDNGNDYVNLFEVGRNMVIDPAVRGNPARFVNHSCDPNCETVVEDGRVYIESIKPIKAGEELFYDYSLRLGKRPSRKDRERYACRCGSRRCRGTMLHLPPSLVRPKRQRLINSR